MSTRFLAWLLFLSVALWGTTGYFIYKIAINSRWLGKGQSSTTWATPRKSQKTKYQATVSSHPVNLFAALNKEEPDSLQQLATITKPILESHQGVFGVYFEDLESGSSFGFNEDRIFYAASLAKVPLLVGTFISLEKKEITVNTSLTYLEEDFEEGDGSIQNQPFGTSFTLDQVLTKLCKESDNAAKNILFRTIATVNIRQVLQTAGAKKTDLKENLSTPKEIASIFKIVYENKVTSKESGTKIFDLLTGTTTEDRLPEPLPKDIVVSHKIGTWPDTDSYHDCGIIFAAKPYILCIMSENSPYGEAVATIQEVSKTIYESLAP
ncbi:MAG: serine hydrolase [bacterium]|nr:serine hydrolase [bacterium]